MIVLGLIPGVCNKIHLKLIARKISLVHNIQFNRWILLTLRREYGNETITGLILGLRPANERRHYKWTPFILGWAQTWNQPCIVSSTKPQKDLVNGIAGGVLKKFHEIHINMNGGCWVNFLYCHVTLVCLLRASCAVNKCRLIHCARTLYRTGRCTKTR